MRIVAAAALVVIACLGPSRARAQPRGPACDPVTWTQPADPPPERRRVCGDGRVGTFDACMQVCSGGCPGTGCETRCETGREVCDGADLDGATCRSLGLGEGRLACGQGCAGYDVSGCDPCLPGASCTSRAVPEAVSSVRAVESRGAVLVLASSSAALRWAIAAPTLRPWASMPAARAVDAVAIASGWIVATVGEGAVTLTRIDRRGVARAIETLAASEVALWAIDGGGVIVTTGTAFGAPFRMLDARGRPMRAGARPVHAMRADGARMWALAPGAARELSEVGTGMRVEWRAADLVIAFVSEQASGAQVVEEGVILTGLGHGGPSELDLHLGGDGERAARVTMSRPGEVWSDAIEPARAAATRVSAEDAPTSSHPAVPLFAEHPSISAVTIRRTTAGAIGTALFDAGGAHRVVLARSAR
jgi:hypothetical protein